MSRTVSQESSPCVLVVDDDEAVRDALESTLEEAGYRPLSAASLASAREILATQRPDVVLLDVRMGDGSGLDFLAEVRGTWPDLPVIMATAYGDAERTITAMKGGAFDYVTKPFDRKALLATVERASRACPAATMPAMTSDATFVGSSAAMLPVWKAIGRAASSRDPVLITGETGVGKELTARAIHNYGPARNEPFVAVNLAALPASLLESELFGHERGAFTGATQRRLGRFELAGAGTLFLDEIGDLDPMLQTKLLRVIEEATFERVGGERRIAARARIIAATSKPVRPGSTSSFREDLYYRLSVIPIALPPLRERRSDIPLLVDAFLQKREGPRRAISERALARLTALDWPGNVRQLLHVLANACVMSAAEVLDDSDFQFPETAPSEPLVALPPIGPSLELRTNMERFERTLISLALVRSGGNRTSAARVLGIRRQQLYARMELLGISAPNDEPT